MKRILSLVLCLFVLISLMPNVKADTLTTACGDAFIKFMIEHYGEADLLRAGGAAPDTDTDTVIVTYDYEQQFIIIVHAGMHYGWSLDSVRDIIVVHKTMEEVVETLGLGNSVFIIPYESLLEILEKDIT